MSTAHHRCGHDDAARDLTQPVSSPQVGDPLDPPVPPPLAWPLRIAGGLLLIIATVALGSVAANVWADAGVWIDETGIAAMAVVSLSIWVLRERHSRAWVRAAQYRADGRGTVDANGSAADS